MITFRFGVDDLARTSFAYSPLQEAAFSLRSWRDPARYPHQRPWLRRLRPAFDRQDTELLAALVTPRLWVPRRARPGPRPDALRGRRPADDRQFPAAAALLPFLGSERE
ncbi:hypothetical protein AB0O76_11995 [Streptomyces sp. NPDC086554]|uniref:hypothetical protein n=1 Tax=Streptomyces sp. NPDC086554 TaxID=3154864 RepID=UPI0034237026